MKSMRTYINRTPSAIRRIADHISRNISQLEEALGNEKIKHLYLVGSGTSLNAAYFSRRICSELLGIPCSVYSAMQFADTVDVPGENGLVLGISQAGHSYSTLLALEKAKQRGCISAAVSNDKNAMIRKAADAFLWIDMPEEDMGPKTEGLYASVATIVLAMCEIAEEDELISEDVGNKVRNKLLKCTDRIAEISDATWSWCNEQKDILKHYSDIIVIGAGDCYPSAMEGALKILETTKISVRSYETEEFMHGIYHAIDKEKMIIAIAEGRHYERTIRLLKYLEDKKHCGTFAISPNKVDSLKSFVYSFNEDSSFDALEYLATLQTIAQFMAEVRGIDMDVNDDPDFHQYMGSYIY